MCNSQFSALCGVNAAAEARAFRVDEHNDVVKEYTCP